MADLVSKGLNPAYQWDWSLWGAASGGWVLYPTVTATSVIVCGTVFSLRMGPSAISTSCADFDSFSEKGFEPFLVEAVELQPSQTAVATVSESSVSGEADEDGLAVRTIKKKQVVDGQVRYLVKWVGWNNRFNLWKSIGELHCGELVVQFEAKQTKSAMIITTMSDFGCVKLLWGLSPLDSLELMSVTL